LECAEELSRGVELRYGVAHQFTDGLIIREHLRDAGLSSLTRFSALQIDVQVGDFFLADGFSASRQTHFFFHARERLFVFPALSCPEGTPFVRHPKSVAVCWRQNRLIRHYPCADMASS
jgi:hypothetical protein